MSAGDAIYTYKQAVGERGRVVEWCALVDARDASGNRTLLMTNISVYCKQLGNASPISGSAYPPDVVGKSIAAALLDEKLWPSIKRGMLKYCDDRLPALRKAAEAEYRAMFGADLVLKVSEDPPA